MTRQVMTVLSIIKVRNLEGKIGFERKTHSVSNTLSLKCWLFNRLQERHQMKDLGSGSSFED
jgi:hypothetical protein